MIEISPRPGPDLHQQPALESGQVQHEDEAGEVDWLVCCLVGQLVAAGLHGSTQVAL